MVHRFIAVLLIALAFFGATVAAGGANSQQVASGTNSRCA